MAGLVNLLRNAKVFYTTLTQAQAKTAANVTPANTWELQVLSDFRFSQATEQQTITLNEAGATPARGQRSFNTKINPVDWSFGTYIRPYAVVTATATVSTCTLSGSNITVNTSAAHSFATGDLVRGASNNEYFVTAVGSNTNFTATATPGSTAVDEADSSVIHRPVRTTAPEALLWNALVSADQPYSLDTGTSSWVETGTAATLNMARSNVHSFVEFGLIFKVDNTIYYVDKCAVNQADMAFGIDQIALVTWAGQGTELVKLDNSGGVYSSASSTGTLDKVVLANTWDSSAQFITNKLSTVNLTGYNINGTATQTYDLALTGGQLTITNNIQYLTPETLGAVNKSIGYYSGTRGISGNVTCYLKVSDGSGRYASELLDDLIQHSLSQPDNLFQMNIGVGAAGAHYPQVNLKMPGAMLQIPSVDVQDVVSATINFTAQASDAAAYASNGSTKYSIDGTNELQVEYKTAA